MVEVTFVYNLPVNHDIGFPQTVFTEIYGKYFAFTYRFNSHDDSLILKWVTGSGKIVFLGKLTEGGAIEVSDPDYHISTFLLLPLSVGKKEILVELYAPWGFSSG